MLECEAASPTAAAGKLLLRSDTVVVVSGAGPEPRSHFSGTGFHLQPFGRGSVLSVFRQMFHWGWPCLSVPIWGTCSSVLNTRLIGKSPSVLLVSAGLQEGWESGADGIKKQILKASWRSREHWSSTARSIHIILGMPCKLHHHYCKLPWLKPTANKCCSQCYARI